MHPTADEQEFAISLRNLIKSLMSEHFEADGHVSVLICTEVSIHAHKDVAKLFHTHQGDGRLHQSGRVDPLKIVSIVAFWIRKLKPVSQCFRVSSADRSYKGEMVDINERLALSIAQYVTLKLSLDGHLNSLKRSRDISDFTFAELIGRAFSNLKDILSDSRPEDTTVNTNSIYERILYDMRFRTYGAHHISSMLVQTVSSASQ